MSIYNREHSVVFIHVPKTAGTSMERNYFLGSGGHKTIRDFDQKDIHFNDELHLRSIGIDSSDNGIIDHGKIIDQDNRRISMIETLAADDKGNVFMVGSWYALSPDEATHQYVWPGLTEWYIEKDYPEVSYTYKDTKRFTHKVMHRGQFFSYVNVSKDIKG